MIRLETFCGLLDGIARGDPRARFVGNGRALRFVNVDERAPDMAAAGNLADIALATQVFEPDITVRCPAMVCLQPMRAGVHPARAIGQVILGVLAFAVGRTYANWRAMLATPRGGTGASRPGPGRPRLIGRVGSGAGVKPPQPAQAIRGRTMRFTMSSHYLSSVQGRWRRAGDVFQFLAQPLSSDQWRKWSRSTKPAQSSEPQSSGQATQQPCQGLGIISATDPKPMPTGNLEIAQTTRQGALGADGAGHHRQCGFRAGGGTPSTGKKTGASTALCTDPAASRTSRDHWKIMVAFSAYRRAICATDTLTAVV